MSEKGMTVLALVGALVVALLVAVAMSIPADSAPPAARTDNAMERIAATEPFCRLSKLCAYLGAPV